MNGAQADDRNSMKTNLAAEIAELVWKRLLYLEPDETQGDNHWTQAEFKAEVQKVLDANDDPR